MQSLIAPLAPGQIHRSSRYRASAEHTDGARTIGPHPNAHNRTSPTGRWLKAPSDHVHWLMWPFLQRNHWASH